MKKLFIVGAVIVTLIFLSQVFSGALLLPSSFSLGPVNIRFYGLFMALAVALGFYLAKKRAGKFGIGNKSADNIIFWLVVGGFIGARLYHVASSWSFYLEHPVDILKVWHGGLSIYGAVFGGLSALFLQRKLYTLHSALFTLLNWLTPSVVLGQIIGRFGNLFNYELYGYPTNLPWKMFVPEGFRSAGFEDFNFFHPLFLYEQIGLLIILAILYRLENRGGTEDAHLHNSNLFLLYVLLYNIVRCALEFLRIDSVFWGNLRVNSLMSLGLVMVAAVLLIKHGRFGKAK
jgi:phosphatidylglycerol:prolipoprotein diacylglycerol transferase